MWRSEGPVRRSPRGRGALLILLGVMAIGGQGLAEAELPDTLGQWYKPANPRQVWLHTMFALRRELQAVREYAEQGEGALLVKWAGQLAGHYRKLPEMVPEWGDQIDTDLAEEVSGLASAGDFAGTLRALKRLERDCTGCHREYQAVAALRFRWPRFDTLRIDEGQGGGRGYPEHMELLSVSVNRIKIASEDQRWEVARGSLTKLRGQLRALGEVCGTCHEEPLPRERILGRDTEAMLTGLQEALAAQDPDAAGRQLGEVAVQTCARCHGVHRLLSGVQRHLFPQDRR